MFQTVQSWFTQYEPTDVEIVAGWLVVLILGLIAVDWFDEWWRGRRDAGTARTSRLVDRPRGYSHVGGVDARPGTTGDADRVSRRLMAVAGSEGARHIRLAQSPSHAARERMTQALFWASCEQKARVQLQAAHRSGDPSVVRSAQAALDEVIASRRQAMRSQDGAA